MKRVAGVVILLAVLYGLLDWSNPKAFDWRNLKDVLNQQAFFGVLTLGVGVLIVTGGIDLSIGSVVGMSAVLFGVLLRDGYAPYEAVAITLSGGVLIGSIHALLITKLKLQPFLVTLCGLFIYRGAARMLSPGKQVGLRNAMASVEKSCKETGDMTPYDTMTSQLTTLRETLIGKKLEGELDFPMEIVVLGVLALGLGLLLHFSVWGRHWYAIGHNEQAAKYAGIRVERNKFAVYVLCSTLASLGGILTFLDYGSVTPESIGESWELYAITGAVLGGCSLRGGDGSVPGMVLGAAVLPLLKNLISFVGTMQWVLDRKIKVDPIIPALIGLTLLIGTIADEFFRRRADRKV